MIFIKVVLKQGETIIIYLMCLILYFFGGGNVSNWKGYAIHGAYWHNDFGIKNRSSSCVNVKPEEAGLLYQWADPAMPEGVGSINSTAENPGVRVVIHE